MQIDRSLFIRSNRSLGLALLEADLVTLQQQELASVRLMEVVRAGSLRGSGILPILIHDLHALEEAAHMEHLATRYSLGLMDLRAYDVHLPGDVMPAACWATWTVPFDEREGTVFLASAYYLSNPVRSYWEQLLGSNIIWYASPLKSLTDALERISASVASS